MARTIVLSTCATLTQARKIARDLLQRRLAACVNIVPVTSHYRWKGKIHTDHECLMIIKTKSEAFVKLKSRILALHTYKLPEIVSFKIDKGYTPYLAWIDQEVHE